MPFGDGLYVFVVIGIFKPGLQHVVVDIGDRELCLDPADVHGLKLQVGHRAGRVLG
ncbi:hypothetical protein SDC9_212860 [bioreactor metagenome]|uniref:Uncharacterized protein n=1 Tax=bioreactor metagenome TaxID=1076179 RepID=A0A645JN74_9ZZZZ